MAGSLVLPIQAIVIFTKKFNHRHTWRSRGTGEDAPPSIGTSGSFHFEQCFFAIDSPAISAHPAILANYTMTRNCHSHLVRSASPSDGSCCCGLSDGLRHLAIGLGRAKRNRLKIRPHSPLKGGRLNI